jgi:outer membrane lipoprotein-sorting protein
MFRWRYGRYLLIVPLLGGAAMFANVRQEAPTHIVTPQPAPVANVAAMKVLQQALEAASPDRLGWIRADVWQQAHTAGLTYQSEGRYLAGPKQRLRFDLHVHCDRSEGELTCISDGNVLWTTQTFGREPRVVSKVELATVADLMKELGAPPAACDFFLRCQSFAGPQSLLIMLQKQVVLTSVQAARWNGRLVRLLTGVVSSDRTAETPLPASRCRLFLDAQTLFPLRVEWWGQDEDREALLMQLEFRNAERLSGADPAQFVFKPGKAVVHDRTEDVKAVVRSLFAKKAG